MNFHLPRMVMLHSAVALNVATILACGSRGGRSVESHPVAIAGRWVRQQEAGTPGDTIDFRTDGTVGGSTGNPVPPSARWGVTVRNGREVFCARDSVESSCQTYRLHGNALMLGGGPSQTTTYHRVP